MQIKYFVGQQLAIILQAEAREARNVQLNFLIPSGSKILLTFWILKVTINFVFLFERDIPAILIGSKYIPDFLALVFISGLFDDSGSLIGSKT